VSVAEAAAPADTPRPAAPVANPWQARTSETPPPAVRPERTFADALRDLDPSMRYEAAEAIAAYGQSDGVEEREAYAVALRLLDSFPIDHRYSGDAKRLQGELVLRQQLPTADPRPVSDREQAAFFAKVLRAADSQAPRENAAAAPSYAPPEYNYVPPNLGGPVHVRGHYRSNGSYVQPHTRSAPRR
jgi:hypothetical protein